MRTRVDPLLCELHAHTTWSDSSACLRELVDLYGLRGFDVLCITDHTVRADDPWFDPSTWPNHGVGREAYSRYLDEILRAAPRPNAVRPR